MNFTDSHFIQWVVMTEKLSSMEDMIPNEGLPKVAAAQPCCVQLEAGKNYAWCTCGLSEKQPFCDGRHKKVEGMPYRSQVFTVEQNTEAWLCQCKKTKNPPYCDGSHNK